MSSELVRAPVAHEDKREWCMGGRPNMARRVRARDAGPPVRDADEPVVPSARGDDQQALEAATLFAAVRTMDGFRRRGRPVPATSVVRRVWTDDGPPALEVPDAAVNDFLAEVLPCVVGDRLVGVPGVRPVAGRKHLDLRVAGTGARVRLLGVSRERWRDAADRLGEVGDPVWRHPRDIRHPRNIRHGDRHPLEPAPGPVRAPIAVASGVLRRLPLWKGATWLCVVDQPDALEVYWRSGPSGAVIAAILGDSCCRLPDVSATPFALPDGGVRGVRLVPGATGGPRVEPEWAWVEWLARSAPAPGVAEIAVRTGREAPGGVLPHLWEQDDVRTALARREIGPLYRLLRSQGLSLDRLVALTGQSRVDVEAVLSGRPVEDYDTLCRIAEGLGVPPGYMGLAHDERPVRAVGDGAVRAGGDETAKRNAFLAYAAAVTVGAAFPDQPWDECPGCRQLPA